MAGMFELFVDADAAFRFRLTAPDGTVMAVSKAFDDKPAAVAGIAAVREYAGMGLITDLCPAARPHPSPAPTMSVHQSSDSRRVTARDLHASAAAPRRAAHSTRLNGAA
ncbi:DUF1508 domain-containing protein [Arthrobacter sp. ISL-5]|uniref:YegP family protein n=1 Tax=Arthrobacter sp. ISL-5 TaxID=2819111 RepID=UPI001BED222C|nr:DUF1508 domain-containing protein [Arthrobacter sp. ISL-5]MBT2555266.1 DUF1508 domain-containing protein [Arthrobacter sp. ISL-5]